MPAAKDVPNVCNGRGAGPDTFVPANVKAEPWHGQMYCWF
jgi:hypothetical protein